MLMTFASAMAVLEVRERTVRLSASFTLFGSVPL